MQTLIAGQLSVGSESSTQTQPLNLLHLGSVFFLYGVMIAVAIGIFTIEAVAYKKWLP